MSGAYWKVFAEKQAGLKDITQAREAFIQLYHEYPEDESIPRILFQIALTYYNEEQYNKAQQEFQKLAEKHSTHEITSQAIYIAGCCAMNLENYEEAIAIFERIPLEDKVKPHAHLGQIRCFMLRGQHENALKIAEALTKEHKEGPIWVEATLRKVDTLFLTATDKPENLKIALKESTALLNSNTTYASWRNRAGFMRGRILIEMGRETQALEAFMDVVYGNYLPSDITQQAHEPELLWFIKSGLKAAEIKEDKEDIQGAVAIYRILEQLGSTNRGEFRRKIDDLKSRHFIWEES
ncbi:MAG: tetratricopeptide repeat protein [Verrucomicrobiota bacterium]